MRLGELVSLLRRALEPAALRRALEPASLRRALDPTTARRRLGLAWAAARRRSDAVLLGAVVAGVVMMILHWS